VLAGTFLIVTAAMIVLPAGGELDLTAWFASQTDEALPFAMQLPVGVLAFPLSFVMVALICDLYGVRRARAVVMFGAIASFALVVLLRVADEVSGATSSVGPALAFTACYLAGHLLNLEFFDAASRKLRGRHLWLRANASTAIAQIGGWAAFGLVSYYYTTSIDGARPVAVMDHLTAVVVAAAAYTMLVMIAATVPFVIAARALSIYLRVGDALEELDAHDAHDDEPVLLERRRRPPAMIVEELPARRAARSALGPQPSALGTTPPYSSAEMRFFTEGEELAEVTGD
jgi:uncharacterized PurR-regulated membrane protein YhhQ (DUF165 family)